MRANINNAEDEKLRNTVSKDSKKYQDDIQKYELELSQIESKLMVK